MTVESLTELGLQFGLDNAKSGEVDLRSVLTELQNIKLTIVSGQCNGSVAMTVSGIATTDTILSAWEAPTAIASATNLIDRTAATSISAASTVICTDGMSSTSLFFVLWFNKDGA
jgi:hypothetical protein